MIRQKADDIRYFLYSRHVSDAVLITAGIIIPSVILARFGLFEMGVVVSLGALCVGTTDSPGSFRDKVTGMGICNCLIFVVALITGYAGASVYFESAEIVLFCFLFSMFTLYGPRAASVGTVALMVMITMMYRHKDGAGIPEYAGLLLAGGTWYTVLSILFYKLRPYRQIEQVVGECILETTRSLRLKAKLYDMHTKQSVGVNALILEQIRLNEKQEDARQLLFTNPLILNQGTQKGKVLTAEFVEVMDVYEEIVSTSYYETIRVKFAQSGVLPLIEELLNKIADNLVSVGRAVQANSKPRGWVDVSGDFVKLKKVIDVIASRGNENTFILKKAMITFRTMDQRVHNMANFLTSKEEIMTDHTAIFRFDLFLTPREFGSDLLLGNLSFRSSTFRYAVRVALVAFFGFVIANLLSGAGHSYWILFTVVFIIKPAFSLSKERNYQRIGGTILGGLIAFPVMLYVHSNTLLFVLLMLFMIVAYSFMRINYLVFVAFMTSYLLLMFKLLGAGSLDIVGERVADTLIGALMAFAAIYFIFPNWEFKQIRVYIKDILVANKNYLAVLEHYFSGAEISVNEYKLARKDAYTDFARLAGSFQRMNSEPKSKQKSIDQIQLFIVANHQLSSLISSNAAAVFTGKLSIFRNSPLNLMYIRQSIQFLGDALQIIEQSNKGRVLENDKVRQEPDLSENPLVKSQLKIIRDRCAAIRRTTRAIFDP